MGAFGSAEQAIKALQPYKDIPFVYGQWPSHNRQPFETVWVLPYKGCEALIACASDDRAEVEEAQKLLLKTGLVYEDDIMYNEATVGEIPRLARQRLDLVVETLKVSNAGGPPEEAAAAAAADAKTVEDFLRFAKYQNGEGPGDGEGPEEGEGPGDGEGAERQIGLLTFVVPKALDVSSP